MAAEIKPDMWVVTQEDEILLYERGDYPNSSAYGYFGEYDELGVKRAEFRLLLQGLKPAPRQDYERKLGCDDLVHNVIPNLLELADNVVHFHHDQVTVTLDFGGKRFCLQITES